MAPESPPTAGPRTPRLVQITDATMLSEAELGARLDALARRPADERAGAVVLLRDPQLASGALIALARRLRQRTRELGAQLWINDRLDVAALVQAEGIHLGRRSVGVAEARSFLGRGVTISVACHVPDEVLAARAAGADAATLSPIFDSPGKGAALGLPALREARKGLGGEPGFTLIALGGVDAVRARLCRDAGADAAAAIRADLWTAASWPR